MKKILSVLLALCLVLAAVPAAGIVVSADETFGDFTYGRMALSDEIEITGYNGSSAEITIPSQIGDEDVKAIGGNAFKNNTTITSVEIPSTVKTIKYNAFQGCEALKSITVPDSVTAIGEYAFDGCSALKEIQVADSNPNYQDIDGVLFSKDGSTLIKYPDDSDLVDYVVPDGCTRLEDWSFTGAKSLKSIDIQNIQELGEDVFFYCQSLTDITIPDSITEIPNNTFTYCTELTSITLPKQLTSIGDFAFYTCVRLENITIPDTVTKIGKQAFYNCLELHELTLPSGIKELGDGAFGLYAESDDTSPSVVKDFSVTYGKNSKIKKYVSQYKIPATETAGSNSWVVPVCIGGGVVVVAAIVVILVVRKKRKGGAA